MYIFRDDKVVEILGLGEGLRSVSGQLKPGDGLVVTTKALVDVVDGESLGKKWVTAKGNVGVWVDQLTPVVHAQESSGVAGVFLGVLAKVEPVIALPRLNIDKGPKLVSVARKWQGWWGKWRFSRGADKKLSAGEEVYVGKEGERRKRVAAAVALVVGVMLGLSLVFGVIRQKTSEEANRLREIKVEVERVINEATALKDLNKLRAGALIEQARINIDDYLGAGKVPGQGKTWGEETKVRLAAMKREIMNVYEVLEAEVFMDLDLVRKGSEGRLMDFDGEEVVVLDEAHELLMAIKVTNKKAGVVGGGELLRGAHQAAVWGGRGFVAASSGVVELDINRKTSAVAIKGDGDWGEIGAMDVFGGNLYLLDKLKGQIYRYTAAAGGFSTRKDWLGKGVSPDFSQVVAMVIDGNIWILTKTGKVEKYSLGTGRAVELVGLDTPLSEPVGIYTDENSLRIYILDRGNKRVVVFSKEGLYEASYQWEGIGDVTDMVVVEEEKKVLLLAGSKIYELALILE